MAGRGESKWVAIVVVTFIVFASSGIAIGRQGGFDKVRGMPESMYSRVAPAADGTRADTGTDSPNGIAYFWEQAESFIPGVSVATFGTNTKGIAIDISGTWTYNATYTQCTGDVGSIFDAWSMGERAVMIYEVFNDQSVSWRNYTCIFEEDAIDGDGSTNFGTYSAQSALTPINDPALVGVWVANNTAMISIPPQTTGFEVTTLFDGYRVFKSTAGPITQTNQGTALGDATLENGVWVYRDTACTVESWYAVKVKWDGGTYPFIAPLYSYGMSNDVLADIIEPLPGPEATNPAAGPNPHNGNTVSELVTVTATITSFDVMEILSAQYRVDGGAWVTFPQTGVSPLPVSAVYQFPNGFREGAHLFEVRGYDGYIYGSIASGSFNVVDTTAPLVQWISTPAATMYVTQPLNFMMGYEDFTAYNPNFAYSYLEWRVNNGTWNKVPWTNQSFAWGSYLNILACTLPGGMFAMGDWVDYRGYVKDTAVASSTSTLAQGSVWFWTPPPPRAEGLWVERADPDIVLHWFSWQAPTDYWEVYYTTNRFATFPSGWTMATVASSETSWTHANAYGDGNTWYYQVRGMDHGTPTATSSMAVKAHRALFHNTILTNINWISLPYNSMYKRASDIVRDLEGGDGVTSPSTKINVVGLWMPGYQASTGYIHVPEWGEWTGDDFQIPPGAGIYVSILSDFNWIINGTDSSEQLNFTHNAGKTNIMFFSIPPTCAYQKAHDIVMELEGALFGPGLDSKINVIGLWVYVSQASTAFVYDSDFEEWTGDDFTITAGCGIYISVTSDFTWTPQLITPEVP